MKHLLLTIVCLIAWTTLPAQDMRQDTYCNPLNIDYTYMIYNSDRDISYRSGADPAVVEFRGEYYMFVTRSHGYWRSRDLLNWEFVRPGKNWYPQGCNAPAAHNYKDSVLYVAGDPSGSMSILYTDDPASGDWEATPAILHNLQDPDLFIDDDGKAYMFWGSSNVYPIRGMELDKDHRFTKKGETKELFNLDMPKHGWERFGENHTDTVLGGYIEGPWLTKHNGKYYMQYGAPGTEFNVYADGVYVPVKQNVQRIFNQLFIHGGQHAAAVNTAGGCTAGIGQFFHLDGLAAALCAAPQKVVTGNIIVIRNLHHKFKAAFPDAFLIMGKLRLADAKLLRRLFLGNAPLFAQQGNDAVKFHCHLVAILHTLPERSAQRPHRVCTASPGCRNRTFRRFLQHLRGRHAPAVLFSALRVCTAACRLTPCRACGR